MKPILLTIIYLLLLSADIHSQQHSEKSENAQIDNTKINTAHISTEKLNSYKTDSDFEYIIKKPEKGGFWALFWFFVNEILKKFFSNEGVIVYIRYILFAIIIIFVVYKIINSNFKGIFLSNKILANKNTLHFYNEDINEENLDEKLQNVINQNNYRAAIRYYYIMLLKNLDLKKLIYWQQGKTNYDYQNELQNKDIKGQFIRLSSVYEYSWYGNFQINEKDFKVYQKSFLTLIDQI